jgi:acetyl-CoA carboxylase beta subunit
MGSDKEIEMIITKCPLCEETMFPKKTDVGNNVYKCTECGGFIEIEEQEEKTVVFEPEMDLDPTIH